MVRTPIHYVDIGNTSLEELGLSHLVSSIYVTSAVDMMQTAQLNFAYGHELDTAYSLLTHGEAVKIYLGYAAESNYPVFTGFISGLQINIDQRTVQVNLSSYFEAMNTEQKKRSFSGQSIFQILNSIADDYPNIEVGTIDNGDYILSDDYRQDSSDLDCLVNIARKTGMHLVLEPSPQVGSQTLQLSLFTLGREVKPVEYDEIVYNPDDTQQNQLFNWHLKSFKPTSTILGENVSVTIQSVNPRYAHTTTVQQGFDISVTLPINTLEGGGIVPRASAPLIQDETTSVNNYERTNPTFIANGLSDNPYNTIPLLNYSLHTSTDVSGEFTRTFSQGGGRTLDHTPPTGWVSTGESPYSLDISLDDQYVTTTSFQGTDVVFTCFGNTSTIHFSENVSNEDAQRRIAEAIQNDSGFSFVVAKGAQLADGEASLQVGQKRHITLHDFPLFGEAFSGDYVITSVSHVYNRSGEGFTTSFDCAKNTLEIPPEVHLAVGVGAGTISTPESYEKTGSPGTKPGPDVYGWMGIGGLGTDDIDPGAPYPYVDPANPTPSSEVAPQGFREFEAWREENFGSSVQATYAYRNNLDPVTLIPNVFGTPLFQDRDTVGSISVDYAYTRR